MSEVLRLFFAYSFAPQRMNSHGSEDSNGISDLELADRVSGWIREFGAGRIEIVRTCDPYKNYISSQVRRDICSCDVILCLFTKRTEDHVKHRWLPSTYVISEASAGLMQYSDENETHQRLFGLVEEGVDHEQLGMAFPQNKTAPGFVRSDLDGLRSKVKEIVDAIFNKKVAPRRNPEYLSLDKTATIWRNGAVTIECRHRFRFLTAMNRIKIPHAIWRISQSLPPIKDLLNAGRNVKPGYLRCVPVNCGGPGQKTCHHQIIPKSGGTKNEHLFDVEFSDLDIHAGDELEYEIAWGYRHAFCDPSKQNNQPNSVGLRTGERGEARSVSLTLQFQRDLEDDASDSVPILEEPPVVFTTQTPVLPANASVFWNQSATWHRHGTLQACPKRSGAMWEVYRWNWHEPFEGTAKINWAPHLRYLQDEKEDSADAEIRRKAASKSWISNLFRWKPR